MKSVLFDECIEVLNPEVAIISQEETDKLFDQLESMFPIGMASRIMWEDMDHSYYSTLQETTEVFPALKKLVTDAVDPNMYILWNDADIPVIETDIHTALSHIDDVLCVASDTWFFNIHQKYVVEFYHLGEMRVGIAPYSK